MATRGSTATAAGLALTMIAVGAGVSSGGSLVLLLSFTGVLAGAGLIFVGIHVADDPTAPIGRPGVLVAGVHVRALVQPLRRNLALVGLLLASSAASVTAAAAANRETAPILCFSSFNLLLLGLALINIGVLLAEQEQGLEH